MAVVICGDSARHMLEGLSDEEYRDLMFIDSDDIVFEVPGWKEVRDLALSIWNDGASKVDLLVRNQRDRKASPNALYHVWQGPIPPHSIVRHSEDVCLTTPCFDLLLGASRASLACISKRIMETTGIFKYDPRSVDGFVEHLPWASQDSLEDYVASSRGLMGVSKLCDALTWSPPKARSPREIDLTLPLTMPRRLNGCGMPIPELNREIRLKRKARSMLGQDTCFVDLFWKSRLDHEGGWGIEYLGKGRHANIGQELQRVNALELQGIEIHLVANEQLTDARQLLMTAKRVSQSMGFTPRGGKWPSEQGLQGLIDEIIRSR